MQREPIELLISKGKKHLTKEEIENRKNAEIKANNDNIIAPSYLSTIQKKEFNQIANELLRIDIMSNLDCDCLARYIISKDLYLKMNKKLNDKEIQDDIFELEKVANLQDKFFKQCQATAKELGLTISSRCKLVIPKQKEPEKENKFIKFEKRGVANE